MINERHSEIAIEKLPPMRVATFRAVSLTPEEDSIKVLDQWTTQAGLRGPARRFGFDTEVSPEQAAAGLRGYESWVTVPAGVLPSAPVAIHDFPGGRFAVMTLFDPFDAPFERIPAGWGLLHEWVITHGLEEPGESMCLEELVERDGRRDLILYHVVKAE